MEPNRKSIFSAVKTVLRFSLPALLLTACATRRFTDPLTPQERINLGVAYEQSGNLPLALREYQRAEQGGFRALALTYQGNIHVAMGEFLQARRAFRAALDHDPDELTALNNLAWLLASEFDEFSEAESLIRHALSLNPDPPDPFLETLENILKKGGGS
jgi:tetratricopeptide (TPR) repeat protein